MTTLSAAGLLIPHPRLELTHRSQNPSTTVRRVGNTMRVILNYQHETLLRRMMAIYIQGGCDTQPILNRVYDAYQVLNAKLNSYSFDNDPSTARFLPCLKAARDQVDRLHKTLLSLKQNQLPSLNSRMFYHLH